ncbi:MAG: hypothetical protein AB7Q81_22990 [Gammaproteobacteria bacterium]
MAMFVQDATTTTGDARIAHFSYASWLSLFAGVWLLIVDQRLQTVLTTVAGRGAAHPLSSPSRLLPLLCVAYVCFRLVRPFPFLAPRAAEPSGGLYVLGVALTRAAALSALACATWIVALPYLVAGLAMMQIALPILVLGGFLCVEAAVRRAPAAQRRNARYLDGGLVAALFMTTALSVWFVLHLAPRSGVALLVLRTLSNPTDAILVIIGTGMAFGFLWTLLERPRRVLRRYALWRAIVCGCWVPAIYAFAVLGVGAHHRQLDSSFGSDRLWRGLYEALGGGTHVPTPVLIAWGVVTFAALLVHLAQRREVRS